MEALAQNTYTMEKPLRERVVEILAELKMNKAELALRMNFSRSAVSQYLNGKYNSNPEALEEKLTEFVKEYEEHVKAETGEVMSTGGTVSGIKPKIAYFESSNEEGWLYEEGADIEDLEDLRTRAEDAWSELAERTTEEKLINVSKKVSGVLDVRVDAQHPRGQGTTDIIITSTSGEATQELLKKVENATTYLKGNYDDFLYKSSTIVNVDIKLTLYIAKDASTDGVQQTAEKTIEKFMQLSSREELNCLYMDDIRYALKSDIETYKRAEISSPDGDIELDKGKVIMLGGIEVIVKNVGGA